MWKLLILVLSGLPAFAAEERYPLLATTYDVLADLPGCTGPGHVAFRVEGRQEVPVDLYPAAFADENSDLRKDNFCTVTERKGGVSREARLPCKDSQAGQKALKARLSGLCEVVRGAPRDPVLDIQMTACLSPDGFRPIDGRWSLSGETGAGAYTVGGGLRDEGLDLLYIAGHPQGSVMKAAAVLTESGATPARLRLWIRPADSITLPRMPAVGWLVSAVLDLNMLDASRADCLADPVMCLSFPSGNDKDTATPNSFSRLYEALAPKGFGPLPAPSLSGFAKACHEN